MYELYFQKFNEKVPLAKEEEEFVKQYLTPKKLRKKQYLLQEGDVCKATAFVEKGVLRMYTVTEDGTEHIVQFALEGWFISDLYSFLTAEPSVYNIDAIEDAELVLLNKKAADELQATFPKFQAMQLQLITRAYIALQKRINATISLNNEERYQRLVSTYPDIVQRVPQHMIASYLGLTPETLSRVRRRIADSK